MRKVDKLIINEAAGIKIENTISFDIYFANSSFWVFLDDKMLDSIPQSKKKPIKRKKSDGGNIEWHLSYPTIGELKSELYNFCHNFFLNNYEEQKIIAYDIKFNSSKTYFNHDHKLDNISTPALSIWYRVYYMVKLSTGIQKILTQPYSDFHTTCSYKRDWEIGKQPFRYVEWSEERELFFKNTCDSMELMIEKIHNFFDKSPLELASNIDNNIKALN